MRRYAVLIVPIGLAMAATMTDYLPFKMGVPSACALILLGVYWKAHHKLKDIFWLVGAFAFSAIGDFFLSNKSGTEWFFVIGIGMYLIAHIGYLGFALRNGRLHRITLTILLVGYLPYYFLQLNPAIADGVLSTAVLLYLLISCTVLAAAWGMSWTDVKKWLYVFGIFLILFSDTLISFNEFLNYRDWNDLILPTYYMAHISITLAILLRDAASRRVVGETAVV